MCCFILKYLGYLVNLFLNRQRSVLSLCCECSAMMMKQRDFRYMSLLPGELCRVTKVLQHPLFSWTFFRYIFLYRNCTALLYLNSSRGFNGSSLSFLVLVTALKNFYESALCMFFGKTQTFKIYVGLVGCQILWSMSRYSAGSATKLWQICVVLCSLERGSKDTC